MPIDYKKYPKNWKAFSLEIRRERAKNRCECEGECGNTHGGRCPEINGNGRLFGKRSVVLTVAHLWKDKCLHYNDGVRCAIKSHVKAMCEGCHLNYDREQHMANRKANKEEKRIRRQPCFIFFQEPND